MTPDFTMLATMEEDFRVNLSSGMCMGGTEHFPLDDIFKFKSSYATTEHQKKDHNGLLISVDKLISNSYIAATCTSMVNALTSSAGQVNATQLYMNLRYALPRDNVSFDALPLRLAEYIRVEDLPACLFDLEIKFNLVVSVTRAMLHEKQSPAVLCHQVVSNWQELSNHLSQAISLLHDNTATLHLELPDHSSLIRALKRCEQSYSPILTNDLMILLPGNADRRRSQRYSCQATIPMELEGNTVNVVVSNISSSGMRLFECTCLKVGDNVFLKLGQTVSIEGEVVWTSNGAAGVSFSKPIDNAKRIAEELAGTMQQT